MTVNIMMKRSIDSDGNCAKKKRPTESDPKQRRKRNWTHEETTTLIAIWGQKSHQEGFEGLQYNSRVWASILSGFLEKFPNFCHGIACHAFTQSGTFPDQGTFHLSPDQATHFQNRIQVTKNLFCL